MRTSFNTRLIAAAFAFSVFVAPDMTKATSACSASGLPFVSVDEKTTPIPEGWYDVPTPPLTRPPSVEYNDNGGVTVVTETFIFPENVLVLETRGQEEQQQTDGSWFVRNLTTAVMLAVRFLVGPLRVRTRQHRCRNDETGDDDPLAPRPSLWEQAKASARKVFDKAKEKIGDVVERFRGLLDDPVARTARLVALAKTFSVRDLPRKAGHERHDSDELFERDRKRLGADEAVAGSVKHICSQVAKKFLEVGYNQGFDAACKSIFQCVGGNILAAVQVYSKWAVPVSWLLMNEYDEGQRAIEPAISYTWSIIAKHAAPVFGWLSRDPVVGRDTADEMVETIIEHMFFEPLATCCSRLGFSKRVVDDIIEETIKAGVHGPAITIFVVMSLLCVAEKQGAGRVEEVVMMKVPLRAAAKTVRSFKDLQEQAPITLVEFMDGYRDVMADIAAGAKEQLKE